MSANVGEVLAAFRCLGHPAVRATHAKTLEFCLDAGITARATCVLGVGARWEKPPAGPIAGPVLLRLDAGGEQALVRAVANPRWEPGRAVIVRRSGNRLPDTLATDADLAAADLPREFVARLHDPAGELRVSVERAAGRAALVLLALADRPELLPRLLAECAAADVIVAEDAAAADLLRRHGVVPDLADGRRVGKRRGGGRPAAGRGRGGPPPADAGQSVADALDAGRRALVVSTSESPGTSVTAALSAPDRPGAEVVGLTPSLAAAAASPSRAPALILQGADPRRLRPLIRDAPPGARLVFPARAADVPELCRAADGARPAGLVAAARLAPALAERVLRLPPEQVAAALPAQEPVVCCLDAASCGGDAGQEDVRRLIGALAGEQVPTRTLAAALAQAPGWSRNRAYEFVAAIAAERAAGPAREER